MKTLEVLESVLKGKRIRPNTVKLYRNALSSLARRSEDWPESGVVINEWLASLEGYSDTTIRMWYDYVKSAGKYVQKIGGKKPDGSWKVPNPCDEADSPRVSRKRRRYFTAVEVVKIIKACRLEVDRILVMLLMDSTCRIGELEGFAGKQIGDSWIDVKGKTGERRYRLDSEICARLKVMAGGDDKPVFKNTKGGFTTVDVLKYRVRKVIAEAGITGSKLGAHTLRHSGGALVAQATGSALAVKALLQHDNIDTSMGYIHDAEEVLQQRISPLRLVGEQVLEESMKQLPIGSGETEGVEGEFSEVESEAGVIEDLLEEQFAEIKEGVEVRSLLKTGDLRLMRKAFIGYIRSGADGADEADLRLLLKRMLRKVK